MKKAFTLIELLVVIAIAGILITLAFGSCRNMNFQSSAEEKVIELLEQEGYREITIEGIDLFAGSRDDFYKFRFTAMNSSSNFVSGVVTGDNFKGWTIRRY